jgi:hypothetical protein
MMISLNATCGSQVAKVYVPFAAGGITVPPLPAENACDASWLCVNRRTINCLLVCSLRDLVTWQTLDPIERLKRQSIGLQHGHAVAMRHAV